MNEVGFLLTETKSNIPSYEEFKAQSKGIDDKYNELYLKTEYQLFADSSRMASKWAEIEEDGDRYDLQYRTAHDDKVREEHRALEGTTLPPSDPFWDSYYPPNGYNCRCTVEQVRKGKYPRSNSAAAIDLGNSMTEGKKSIFRFNPGKVKSPYPKKHPYMPTGCGDCDKGLKMAFNPNAEKCKACVAIASCSKLIINKAEASDWIKETIDKYHTQKTTCGRSIKIAETPKILKNKSDIKNAMPGLFISDKRIAHSIRDAKVKRGASISELDLIELPNNIESMDIYYDPIHKNYQFIDISNDNICKKYVFGMMKKQHIAKLTLITAGVIDKHNIKNNKTTKL